MEWEADVVNAFRNNNGQGEISGIRETPTGPSLYLARPFQIKDAACLACHSTADVAPPSYCFKPNFSTTSFSAAYCSRAHFV